MGLAAALCTLVTSSAFADVITNRSYQTGFTLPGVRSPSGNDEVRAADGTTCRSSMANRGAYIDLGGVANENGGKFGDSSVYGRVIIPLGQKPDRIDCNALYQLEIERLRLEMRLLREAAERGPEAPITKDDPFGEGDDDPFSYTPEMETGVSRTVVRADDPFGEDQPDGFVIPANPRNPNLPANVAAVLPVEQTPIAPPVDSNAPTRAPLVQLEDTPSAQSAVAGVAEMPTGSNPSVVSEPIDTNDPLGDLNPYATNYAPLSRNGSARAERRTDVARAFDPLLAEDASRSIRKHAASDPSHAAVPLPLMRSLKSVSMRKSEMSSNNAPTVVFAMTGDPLIRYEGASIAPFATASTKADTTPLPAELYSTGTKKAQPVLDWTPSRSLADELGY